MVKEDERKLLEILLALHESLPDCQLVEAVANGLGMHHKRLTYILHKWTDRREWNYGVSVWSGWFEPAAWLRQGEHERQEDERRESAGHDL